MNQRERKTEMAQLSQEWGEYWRGVVAVAVIYAAFAVASAWAHHIVSLAIH